jgi:FkbM family methyltransferase
VRSVYSFLKDRAVSYLPERLLRPLRAWHYQRFLRSFTDAEEPDLAVVRRLVEPGSVAVDVGANIGIYTKVLSDLVGPTGRVISIEPVPETFAILSQNIRSLGLQNVISVNAAVSDADGEVTMEVPDYPTGGVNFYQASVVTSSSPLQGARRIQVPAARLDTLLRGQGNVDFVKCDVEGYELACLTGSTTILNSRIPTWLIEVAGDPDEPHTSAWKVFRLYNERGYGPWWFDGTRLRARARGVVSTNYFFLRTEHLDRIRRTVPALVD